MEPSPADSYTRACHKAARPTMARAWRSSGREARHRGDLVIDPCCKDPAGEACVRGPGNHTASSAQCSRNFLDDERWRKSVWGRETACPPCSVIGLPSMPDWRPHPVGLFQPVSPVPSGAAAPASLGLRVRCRSTECQVATRGACQESNWRWVPPTPPIAKRRRSTSAVSSFSLASNEESLMLDDDLL